MNASEELADVEVADPCASLSLDGRKARYGLAYVRSICSQAGVPFYETEPDSDVLAVDCAIGFQEADVRVQVKCTSRWTLGGRSLTFPVEQDWVRKWDDNFLPVYFVVVIVPRLASRDWLRHDTDGTFHRTGAYWARLPQGEIGSSVVIDKTQRLTVGTMAIWHEDLLEIAALVRGAQP